MCFENNGPPYSYDPNDHADLEIIKEMHSQVSANKIKITVVFEDQDGDKIEMVARSAYALKTIFKRFPCISEGL